MLIGLQVDLAAKLVKLEVVEHAIKVTGAQQIGMRGRAQLEGDRRLREEGKASFPKLGLPPAKARRIARQGRFVIHGDIVDQPALEQLLETLGTATVCIHFYLVPQFANLMGKANHRAAQQTLAPRENNAFQKPSPTL